MKILPHDQHLARARLKELRAERLKRRFAAVSAGHDREARRRRLGGRMPILALVAILAGAAYAVVATLAS